VSGEARLARLRVALDEQGLAALYVSDPYNRRWLSGFNGSAGQLLVTRDAALIASDFRYWEQIAGQCPGWTLHRAVGPLADWLPALLAAAGGLGGKKLAFEAASLSYAEYAAVAKVIAELPGDQRPEFVPSNQLVEALRAVKDADELTAMQAVIDLGDAAFRHAAAQIRPGLSELAVARLIEDYIRDHGGQGTSFESIVAGGPRGAMPHARATDEPLREGEGIVVDMGASLGGYCSDLTRTVALGAPTPQFRAIYDIVLTAQLTAAELIEPGMTGEQAHKFALRVIEEAGYGEAFGHGLGHGIGLQVHELPRLALRSDSILVEGQVFSIEPGIYLSGWGGVRIEDLFTLENGRCRQLSHAPKGGALAEVATLAAGGAHV
jgi:Xaa-Pro aminopeptidase